MSKTTRKRAPARKGQALSVGASSQSKIPVKANAAKAKNQKTLPRGLLDIMAALDDVDEKV
jgi:hypothetical protein